MLRLSPSRDPQELAQTHRLLDGGPDRVPQQTQVRRIFHIRLHHEAIAPRLQPRVHRMTDGLMAQPDDRTVDLRQDIVCQKREGARPRRRGNRRGIPASYRHATGRRGSACPGGWRPGSSAGHSRCHQDPGPASSRQTPELDTTGQKSIPGRNTILSVRTVDPFAVGLLNERQNRSAGPGITPERLQGSAQHLGIVPGPGIAGDCRGLKVRFSIGMAPRGGCGSKVFRIRFPQCSLSVCLRRSFW